MEDICKKLGEEGQEYFLLSGRVKHVDYYYSNADYTTRKDTENSPAYAGVTLVDDTGKEYVAFTSGDNASSLRNRDPYFIQGQHYQFCVTKIIYTHPEAKKAYGDKYQIYMSTIKLLEE